MYKNVKSLDDLKNRVSKNKNITRYLDYLNQIKF